MKRGFVILFSLSLIFILSTSIVSAGFFSELWNKITGKSVSPPPESSAPIINCVPHYTNNYQCDGDYLQRKYVAQDCSKTFENIEYCENGCLNDECVIPSEIPPEEEVGQEQEIPPFETNPDNKSQGQDEEQEKLSECVDTDDGLDYLVSGTCIDSENILHYDECSEESLNEWYCNLNHCESVSYFCSYGCENGACLFPTGNQKNEAMYDDKQVFIISDKNWQDVLKLVPVGTWTENSNEKDIPPVSIIKKYPTLIFHDDGENGFYHDYASLENGATATASHYYEIGVPENAIDDSMETRWHIDDSQPGWIKINFGEITEINKIVITTHDYIIKIDVSTDGQVWGEIFNGFWENEILDIVPVQARYVKISFPETSWKEIWEIGIYNTNEEPEYMHGYDFDSIIHFLQQYEVEKVILVGETPEELDYALISEPEFGVGLDESQIERLNTNNYFSYWASYDNIVYVENDYKFSLLASTYASLLNAPLIIEGAIEDIPVIESSDATQITGEITGSETTKFSDKHVILIGNVNCPEEARICSSFRTIQELQEKYIELTNTDKLLLVNPNDLDNDIKLLYPFQPEKSSEKLVNMFGKHSLTAPILASAKHELIILNDIPVLSEENWTKINNNAELTDNFVEQEMGNLFNNNAEYLTILASPNAVPDSFNVGGGINEKDYDYSNSSFFSLNVGRIYSLTTSDVSSYLARDIFYNELFENIYEQNYYNGLNRGLRLWEMDIRTQNFALRVTTNTLHSDYDLECYVDRDYYQPCVNNNDPENDVYKNKQFINYWNHGAPNGWVGFKSNDLPNLDLSYVFSNACSTNDFWEGNENVFGARTLRKGAISHTGAVSITWSGSLPNTERAMKELTKEESVSLGKVNSELYSADDHTGHIYRGDFILVGDPALTLNFKQVDWGSNQCNDEFDNDGDGYVDLEDSVCYVTPDADREVAQCSDGVDNDDDNLIDFDDPDCGDVDDDCEFESGCLPPQCEDSLDNEGDGYCDYYGCLSGDRWYEADPSCGDEAPIGGGNGNERTGFECDDGIDNDEDGYCDTIEYGVCLDGSVSGDDECEDIFDDIEEYTIGNPFFHFVQNSDNFEKYNKQISVLEISETSINIEVDGENAWVDVGETQIINGLYIHPFYIIWGGAFIVISNEISNHYSLIKDESIVINGKTLKLLEVYPSGKIKIEVNEVVDTIIEDETKTIQGLTIKNRDGLRDYFLSSAFLKVTISEEGKD